MTAISLAPTKSATSRHGAVRFLFALLVTAAACAPFAGYDYLILLMSVCILVRLLFEPTRYMWQPIDLLSVPVLAIMALSVGWSLLPEATARLAVTFLLIALVVSRLSRTVAAAVLVDTIASGLRISLCASILFAIVRPDVGLVVGDYASGALQGIYNHRNFLAFACVILIACRLPFLLRDRVSSVRLFDLALALGCLVAAQSQTSLIAATAVLGVVVMSRLVGRYAPAVRALVWILISVGTGAVIQLLMTNFASVTQGLGRDTTLTGRTEVWAAVLEEVPRHFWFGAGWGAVWQEGLPTAARMWADAAFKMYHAHNGFLDLLLGIGVVGLLFYLLPIMVALGRALVLDVGDQSYVSTWVSALVTALLVSSIAESPFSTPLGWLSAMAAFFVAVTRRPRSGEMHAGLTGATLTTGRNDAELQGADGKRRSRGGRSSASSR